jgi:choice-of-anchor A domain-containing protein
MFTFTTNRSLLQCANFPEASDYNLIIREDAEQRNSDIEGRAAIGENAVFSSFGIGSMLCDITCPAFGTDPTLVVGGNLTWENGTNFSGNTIMTETGIYNVTNVSYNNADSSLQPIRTSELPIDFTSLFDYYRCASQQWVNFTSLPNTTIVINCFGNVFLIGLNEDINIFQINASSVAPAANVVGSGNNTFDSITGITIIAPDSSTILINMNGTDITFGNYSIFRSTNVPSTLPTPSNSTCNQLGQGIVPTAEQKRLILWNFYNATSIITSNTSFQGTVFAPFATIYTVGGNIEGNAIANNYLPFNDENNHTEVHNYPFNGCLPVVNCTTITSSTTSSTTSSSTTSSSTTSSSTTSSYTTSSYTTSSYTTSSYTTSSSTTSSSTTSSSTTSSYTTSSYTTSSSTTSYSTSSYTTSTTTCAPFYCPCCPSCGHQMKLRRFFHIRKCVCPNCGYFE